MTNCRRLVVCVAAIIAIVNVGVAAAQTVIVRKAPPGATIELVLNTTTVSSAVADRAGDATLPVNLSKNAGKAETDAHVYVDACGESRSVLIIERGVTPPPAGACDRTEMAGLFWVRNVTTMVVDLSGTRPTMRLRQGRAPAEWLRDAPVDAARVRRLAPTGLVLSGAAGFAKLGSAVAVSCGSVTDCAGDDSGIGYTAGASVWVARFLAAEASYVKPPDVTAHGSGTNFRFDSALNVNLVNIVGKVGAPVGPVRIYGQVGPTYHRAKLSTTETIDATTITVDDVAQTIAGGTQTFELRTDGWSWVFGGGLEGWVTNSFALFGEFDRAAVKGKNRAGGEGSIDDRLTLFLFGARVHIGR